MSDAFDKREAAYEAEYFHKKDQEMVEKLRAVFHQKVDKQGIAEATGITDDQVLDNLVKLNLRGDVMAAFQLYPLVAVAWADGEVDENERVAVLNAAQQHGIAADSQAYQWLNARLTEGLGEDGAKVWNLYARELKKRLSAEQLAEFRKDILDLCQRVAESSGGLFNFAFNVSKSEEAVIENFKQALS